MPVKRPNDGPDAMEMMLRLMVHILTNGDGDPADGEMVERIFA